MLAWTYNTQRDNGDRYGFCGERCLQEIRNNVETKANISDPVVRKRQ